MTSEAGKILIVDDDRDFVEAVATFLEAHHYVVLKAYDGREGLNRARAELPDLILMDVIMKERTEGFFTVQEIRRIPELKKVPIFIVSSLYSQIPDFRVTPNKGWLAHDDFLPKPVDLTELLEKIRRRMEGPERNPVAPVGRKAET
jgi:two-component system alkaline phosphatase synthesis response regulator PhoP